RVLVVIPRRRTPAGDPVELHEIRLTGRRGGALAAGPAEVLFNRGGSLSRGLREHVRCPCARQSGGNKNDGKTGTHAAYYSRHDGTMTPRSTTTNRRRNGEQAIR